MYLPHPFQLRYRRQLKGSALLSALFIMTLVAISATVMMNHLSMNVAQTERFIRRDELFLATQMVPFWAMSQLKSAELNLIPLNKKGKVLTYPSQLINQYPGVQLSGEIYDLQNKFNINDLSQPEGVETFTMLITKTAPTINSNLVKMITQATKDWISVAASLNQDKWQQYYSSMKPPYQAAHQPMLTPSELKLVAGVTPTIFDNLEPYITALPETVPININTASKFLLQAVNPKLSNTKIEDLVLFRDQSPILTQESFNRFMQQFSLSATSITFQSRYFLCIATAKLASQTLTVVSMLKRTQRPNKTWQVELVHESFNYW